MSSSMRQLARLLLAFVVVPGLLFPQGGSYCLLRLFGLSEGARKAQCDACCCRAVRMERHGDSRPFAAPASNDPTRADACCLALPEIGGTVDSAAQARLDLKQ